MGVEIIEHQTNAGGLGIIDFGQLADAFGPVPLGPAGSDPDMTPSAQRFATHKLVAHPFALICIVLAGSPPHIPPDFVVDLWAADGESGSHHDFRFGHEVWTMLFHQI